MAQVTHAQASSMVRMWKPKAVANPFSSEVLGNCEDVATLAHPGEGYRVAVTFAKVQGHPEWVRVRATNWLCEDEPNGVYAAEEGRAFYKRLLAAGFVAERVCSQGYMRNPNVEEN